MFSPTESSLPGMLRVDKSEWLMTISHGFEKLASIFRMLCSRVDIMVRAASTEGPQQGFPLEVHYSHGGGQLASPRNTAVRPLENIASAAAIVSIDSRSNLILLFSTTRCPRNC